MIESGALKSRNYKNPKSRFSQNLPNFSQIRGAKIQKFLEVIIWMHYADLPLTAMV